MGDITPFAESLLSRARQRTDDERKRRERRANKAIFGRVGLTIAEKIGNALLAEKTNKFINSTEFKSARQIARAADNNIASFQSTWQKIEQSDQTPQEFLFNQYKPIVEERMKADTESWREDGDDFESVLYKRTQQVAADQLQRLREARAIYEGAGMDKNVDRLAIVAKQYRPQSVEDAISGFLVNSFRGKSREDLEQEEILALQDFTNDQEEGSRGYYAKKLALIKERYDRTGDLLGSKVYTENMMMDEPEPGERFKTIERLEKITVGDRVIMFKVEETYDPKGPTGMDKPIEIGEPVRILDEDLRTEEQLVDIAMKGYNRMEYMQKNFKTPVLSSVQDELANSRIIVGAVDTKAEFEEYEKILRPFLTNKMNYKDERQEVFFKAMAESLFETEGLFKFLDAEGPDFEAQRTAFIERIGASLRAAYQEADTLGTYIEDMGT